MKDTELKQAIPQIGRDTDLSSAAKQILSHPTPHIGEISDKDFNRLITELNAYQDELQKRNNELLRIRTELEESRNKISDLYDFVPVGYFTFDKDCMITDVNQVGAQLLGARRDVLLARAFTELVSRPDIDTFKRTCAQSIDNNNVNTCQLRLTTHTGCEFYAQVGILAIRDTRTSHPRLRASVIDISERRRTLQEITRLAAIVESSDDAIIGKDLTGAITSWNQAAERIYGYKSSEAIGRPFSIILPPGQADDLEGTLANVGRGKKINHFETLHITRDNRPIHVSLTISPIRDADENVIGASTIARDITERYLMEEALRESEERMRSILDASPDAILHVGLDLKVLWANKAALELDREMLGKTCCHTYHSPAPTDDECVCKLAIASGQIEIRSLCFPPGQHRPHEVCWENIGVPLTDSHGNIYGAIMIARDVTERKLAERAMLDYQHKLRDQASQLSLAEEKERRRIATNLHDNIIQGLALSIIRLDLLRESEEKNDNRKTVDEIGLTIRHTIDEMRTMTFELSSPTLYRFGLAAAVDELLDDLMHARHGIEIEFHDDQQKKLLDDDVRVLLFRSVRELLINIIKHAKASKVWATFERIEDSMRITIRDNGLGFNVDHTEIHMHKTGGFGLFSIRERLDYIGGAMKIESQPGKGSTFTLTAPLKKSTG